MMSVAHTCDFEIFAQYCKDVEGVIVDYTNDLFNNCVRIRLSKDGYHVQEIIRHDVIDSNYHVHVLQQALAKLKNHINQVNPFISHPSLSLKFFESYMDELCRRTSGEWWREYEDYDYRFMNRNRDKLSFTQQELEAELQVRGGAFIQMITDFMEMKPMSKTTQVTIGSSGAGGGGTGGGVVPTIFISGKNPGMIVMDEIPALKLKFSDNDIARIGDLKRRAKQLIAQMLLIQQPYLDKIIKDKFVLAGGCFTSWYHGETPKDYDVFILNWTKGKLDLELLSEDRYKVGDANYLNAMNHKAKIVDVVLDKKTNVQYIMTQYKTREELIKNFDVEHACVSYTPTDDKLYISPLTFDCIKNKKLLAHNGDIKSVAAWRLHKFGLKGFTVETVSV